MARLLLHTAAALSCALLNALRCFGRCKQECRWHDVHKPCSAAAVAAAVRVERAALRLVYCTIEPARLTTTSSYYPRALFSVAAARAAGGWRTKSHRRTHGVLWRRGASVAVPPANQCHRYASAVPAVPCVHSPIAHRCCTCCSPALSALQAPAGLRSLYQEPAACAVAGAGDPAPPPAPSPNSRDGRPVTPAVLPSCLQNPLIRTHLPLGPRCVTSPCQDG